jgi:uncharacterized protein YjbI with pentapeptide repeats
VPRRITRRKLAHGADRGESQQRPLIAENGARLNESDLCEADLEGANPSDAVLDGAELEDADLESKR